ncbi:hypothetical protein HY26_17140 [Hyphomonas sp. GM-8P]|nr:hypothetical protein HY26_17140 [Hyphomonas sp. GM-8P]
MNEVVAKQNSSKGIGMLKARQQTYAWATTLQILQLIAGVLVPITASISALIYPCTRPYLASLALLVLILDIAFIDRWMSKFIRQAAKLSELFDCYVLELEWNEFVAGEEPTPESVSFAASKFSSSANAVGKLMNWYPVSVGRAPIHIARLACQRTNLWYDAELRRRYSDWVVVIPLLIVAVFFAVGLGANLLFSELVLAIAVPLTPLLIWSIREHFRHRDTAASQQALRASADALMKSVKSGPVVVSDLEAKSREFQDAIYLRRRANPLVFPVVYSLLRNDMERDMNAGAEELLERMGY